MRYGVPVISFAHQACLLCLLVAYAGALTPSGSVSLLGANGAVIENLLISNSSGPCVTVVASANVVIRNCEIGPCGGVAISVSRGSNNKIVDNYIHGQASGTSPCCDSQSNIVTSDEVGLLIQGNVIAYGESNIVATSSTALSIVGNLLLNPRNSAGNARGQQILLSGYNTDALVSDNYLLASQNASLYPFADNQNDAVLVESGTTLSTLQNNYIAGGISTVGCGIRLGSGANTISVTANTLHNTAACGIAVTAGAGHLLSNNKLLNQQPLTGGLNVALYIAAAAGSACGPVTLAGNVAYAVQPNGTATSYVDAGGCAPVTMTGNTFDAAALAALSPPPAPPLIPPLPYGCSVTSPYTTQTSAPACASEAYTAPPTPGLPTTPPPGVPPIPVHAPFPPPNLIPAPVFSYTDARGTLVTYNWTLPLPGAVNTLGSIVVTVAPVAGSAGNFSQQLSLQTTTGSLSVLGAVWEAGPQAVVNLQLASSTSTVQVTIRPSLVGVTLSVQLAADNALISAFLWDFLFPSPTWPVKVPYYDRTPSYCPSLDVFVNSYLDWLPSNSSYITANAAVYRPLTNGLYNNLQETLLLSVSANFTDVLPTPHSGQSPFFREMAGKLVLDLWGPDFPTSAAIIQLYADYFLTDCLVIIHGWQRSGYDNALPAHFPAEASLGGNPQLLLAFQAAAAAGYRIGLHENYVDYYPNFDNYTTASVMLASDGAIQNAWLNLVQSHACKTGWYLRNAAGTSPVTHATFNTSASFLDVCSSTQPWYRTDQDATVPGSGLGRAWGLGSQALWTYLSATHQGPMLGEGDHHWYWAGALDAAEAQFGAGGYFGNAGSRAPLFVDFDLLKIKPRSINTHGMGYYSRWVAAGEDYNDILMRDAYRMQQVAYAHAPYLQSPYAGDLVPMLWEAFLAAPVARRYGLADVTSVRYYVSGAWVDTSTALKANDSMWRLQIGYSNGDTIVCNSENSTFAALGQTLPVYGWVAAGSGYLAYTALVGGVVADYCELTGQYLFANARNNYDFTVQGALAEPEVVNFTQTGPNSATVVMQWKVLSGPTTEAANAFVHFVPPSGVGIAFQADFPPAPPTTQWLPTQIITSSFPVSVPSVSGTFTMRVGLYSSSGRYRLFGDDDGSERYIVGSLTSSNSGGSLSFTAAPYLPPADPRMNTGGSVVDFGTVATDGMVSITQQSGVFLLWAWPRSRNVTVALNASAFSMPLTVLCDGTPQTPVALPGAWSVDAHGSKSCTWSIPQPTTPAPSNTPSGATSTTGVSSGTTGVSSGTSHTFPVWAIVLTCLGGLAVLGVAVGVIVWFVRRRSASEDANYVMNM